MFVAKSYNLFCSKVVAMIDMNLVIAISWLKATKFVVPNLWQYRHGLTQLTHSYEAIDTKVFCGYLHNSLEIMDKDTQKFASMNRFSCSDHLINHQSMNERSKTQLHNLLIISDYDYEIKGILEIVFRVWPELKPRKTA